MEYSAVITLLPGTGLVGPVHQVQEWKRVGTEYAPSA